MDSFLVTPFKSPGTNFVKKLSHKLPDDLGRPFSESKRFTFRLLIFWWTKKSGRPLRAARREA
jgi:hypothetical protein